MNSKTIDQIELEDFIEVLKGIKNAPIANRALLGYSTASIFLHGKNRDEEVSIRNHSGMFSMLITKHNGSFLFNGGVSMTTPIETAAYILYMAFIMLKDEIKFLPVTA